MCESLAGAAGTGGAPAATAGGGQPHSRHQFLFLWHSSGAAQAVFIWDSHRLNPALLLSPQQEAARMERRIRWPDARLGPGLLSVGGVPTLQPGGDFPSTV